MYYIGIDVSKKVLSVYDGKGYLEFKNDKGLKPLLSHLKRHFTQLDDLGIIFEATGIYSDNLKEFCSRHRIKACILNPKQSHNFAKSLGVRSKTDRIDAHTIWRYQGLIESGEMRVPVIDPEARMLSSYLTSYEFIQRQRISLSNHLMSVTDKCLKRLIKEELEGKLSLEKKILSDIIAYIGSNLKLQEDFERLLTIKGIGEKVAFSLLTLFRNYQGTKRGEITALVGLDPVYKESGSSVKGRIKISKNGNRHVRKILYLPTLSAIRNNRQIALFYQRLVSNHKPKKLAVIAAMRKLILVAHSIYYNKTEYVPG